MPSSMNTVSDLPKDENWRRSRGDLLLQEYPVERLKALATEHGSPVLLLSREAIRRQYQTLKRLLPRVKHHYALKPLPHPEVVKVIQQEDGYFDLATAGEVDVVRGVGVDPARCIHTHPIKRPQDVQYALDFGVKTFVFDNPYELEKLAPFKDKIQLLMRLAFPNKEAQCDLSAKFGVLPEASLALLKKAVGLGFTVAGLSFHVGSQMKTPEKHLEAIRFAKDLVEQARQQDISTLQILDLGGGWPVTYVEPSMSIEDFVQPIRELLDALFPDFTLYSEPGRFIAGPAVTLICSVIGKTQRDGKELYYLDDGLYNSYSGILFDHGHYLIFSLKELENPGCERKVSVLAGPTCDSIDVMYQDILMPEMALGDLMVSPMMGAYAGSSHATDFNFFMRPGMVVVD